MEEFNVGDKVIVPAFGLGIVRNIFDIELEGDNYQMYDIKVLENGLTFKVPVNLVKEKGVRLPVEAPVVIEIYSVLKDHDVPRDKQTWNRRYREYMTKIKTGDPMEVASVLRDLALLRNQKQLSFGERKMYDQAHTLVVQECAIARDTDEEVIKNEISDIFHVEVADS